MGAAICLRPKQISLNKEQVITALTDRHKLELVSNTDSRNIISTKQDPTTAPVDSRLFHKNSLETHTQQGIIWLQSKAQKLQESDKSGSLKLVSSQLKGSQLNPKENLIEKNQSQHSLIAFDN